MALERYQLTLERPRGVSVSEMKEYIIDAVGSMKGCKHPDDPIFDLDSTKVKVRRIKEA